MVTRVSIEEANRHLQALHKRVQELESVVSEQHDALLAKDEHLKAKVAEISSARDADAKAYHARLEECHTKIIRLEDDLNAKNNQIDSLQKNCRVLHRLVLFKTGLKDLMRCIEDGESELAVSHRQNYLGFPISPPGASNNRRRGNEGDVVANGDRLVSPGDSPRHVARTASSNPGTPTKGKRGGREYYL